MMYRGSLDVFVGGRRSAGLNRSGTRKHFARRYHAAQRPWHFRVRSGSRRIRRAGAMAGCAFVRRRLARPGRAEPARPEALRQSFGYGRGIRRRRAGSHCQTHASTVFAPRGGGDLGQKATNATSASPLNAAADRRLVLRSGACESVAGVLRSIVPAAPPGVARGVWRSRPTVAHGCSGVRRDRACRRRGSQAPSASHPAGSVPQGSRPGPCASRRVRLRRADARRARFGRHAATTGRTHGMSSRPVRKAPAGSGTRRPAALWRHTSGAESKRVTLPLL